MSNKQPSSTTFQTVLLSDLVVFQDLTDLNSSFSISGLLPHVPLFVTKSTEGNSFIIIDGYRRFKSLKNNGINQCLCEMIECDDLKLAGLLRIKLNSNRTRSFKENYLFLKWLKNNCNANEYKEITGQLHITDKDRHDYEQLFSASTIVVDAVFKGFFDISNVTELSYFTEIDLHSIINLFSILPFSRQTQRELLEWFPELAFRTKKSIEELIEDPGFQKIYQNQKLNGPQKIKKIRECCFGQRFPTLTNAKKVWNSVASSINPDTSAVSFNTSEAFEKNTLEIKIRVSDAQKAESLIKHLSEIPTEKWEMLIYPALLYGVEPQQSPACVNN